jgi:hypothetical protein
MSWLKKILNPVNTCESCKRKVRAPFWRRPRRWKYSQRLSYGGDIYQVMLCPACFEAEV